MDNIEFNFINHELQNDLKYAQGDINVCGFKLAIINEDKPTHNVVSVDALVEEPPGHYYLI